MLRALPAGTLAREYARFLDANGIEPLVISAAVKERFRENPFALRYTTTHDLHHVLPHVLDPESRHVAYIIRQALDRGLHTLEVSEAAETEWVDTILRLAGFGREFLEACTPGYYNNEGKPGERSGQNGFYGGGSEEFFRILREWRAAGELAGLELR